MSVVKDVVGIRVDGARKQVDALKGFVTEPVGVFETADEMVKNFRATNQATLSALKLPSMKMRGQIRPLDFLKRGKRRIF